MFSQHIPYIPDDFVSLRKGRDVFFFFTVYKNNDLYPKNINSYDYLKLIMPLFEKVDRAQILKAIYSQKFVLVITIIASKIVPKITRLVGNFLFA